VLNDIISPRSVTVVMMPLQLSADCTIARKHAAKIDVQSEK
jgi:hypothetical protein